jgi:hypothetical protein
MSELSHADLVQIACRWLHRRKHCGLVYGEPTVMSTMEIPDAIGFFSGGYASHVVECKVSRADFLADAKKPHRAHPRLGMGSYRWYMVPGDLVRVDELPPNWGLLSVGSRRAVRVLAESGSHERMASEEARVLYAAARRHQIGVRWIPGEYRFETLNEQGERKAAERAGLVDRA